MTGVSEAPGRTDAAAPATPVGPAHRRAVGDVLLTAARGRTADAGLLERASAPDDAAALLAAASRHRVVPRLRRALPDDGAPTALVEALRAQQLADQLMVLRLRSELPQLLDVLAPLPFVLVKGPCLAGTGPDAADRSYVDLDVLVSPGALPDALGLLEAGGYAVRERNWSLLRRLLPGELWSRRRAACTWTCTGTCCRTPRTGAASACRRTTCWPAAPASPWRAARCRRWTPSTGCCTWCCTRSSPAATGWSGTSTSPPGCGAEPVDWDEVTRRSRTWGTALATAYVLRLARLLVDAPCPRRCCATSTRPGPRSRSSGWCSGSRRSSRPTGPSVAPAGDAQPGQPRAAERRRPRAARRGQPAGPPSARPTAFDPDPEGDEPAAGSVPGRGRGGPLVTAAGTDPRRRHAELRRRPRPLRGTAPLGAAAHRVRRRPPRRRAGPGRGAVRLDAGPRCRVWTESELLPRRFVRLPRSRYVVNARRPFPPVRGWILQQVLKLALVERLEADQVLLVDSDVVLVRPVDASAFADPARRPLLFRRDEAVQPQMTRHVRWHAGARRLLGPASHTGRRARLPRYVSSFMLWERAVVVSLVAALQERVGRPWQDVLCGELDLSEWTLYGVYADDVLGYGAAGRTTAAMRCHCYWDPEPLSLQQARAFVARLPEDDLAVDAVGQVGHALRGPGRGPAPAHRLSRAGTELTPTRARAAHDVARSGEAPQDRLPQGRARRGHLVGGPPCRRRTAVPVGTLRRTCVAALVLAATVPALAAPATAASARRRQGRRRVAPRRRLAASPRLPRHGPPSGCPGCRGPPSAASASPSRSRHPAPGRRPLTPTTAPAATTGTTAVRLVAVDGAGSTQRLAGAGGRFPSASGSRASTTPAQVALDRAPASTPTSA